MMKHAILICLLFSTIASIAQTVRDTTIHRPPVSIYFDSDQAEIKPEYLDQLKTYLSGVTSLRSYTIVVEGHADLQGNDDYNMQLSEKRCRSTIDSLVARGIPDSLIQERHFGERHPVAAGADAAALQKNRRVDVILSYTQKLVYLQGKLMDEEGLHVPNGRVTIKAQDYQYRTTTDTTGLFDIVAPAWKDIVISAEVKGHFIRPRTISHVELLKKPTLEVVVPKIEQGKTFVMDNLLFQGNVAILLPSSYDELDGLWQTMVFNPEVCFEIAGHINRPNEGKVPRGSWNHDLSIARALTIRDTLLRHGVHPDRMITKGYGNWHMKFPNATSSERQQLNRRVEIIIKDCLWTRTTPSDSLTADQRSTFVGVASTNWADKKYNIKTFQSDLLVLKYEHRLQVLDHLKLLKSKGISPEGYTYRELIDGVIKPDTK